MADQTLRGVVRALGETFAGYAADQRVKAHTARQRAVYERSLTGGKDNILSRAADLEAAIRDLIAAAYDPRGSTHD